MAAGAMAYTVLGGALTDRSWRGPFALHLLGVLFLIPAYRWLPEPEGAPSRTSVTDDGSEPSETGVPWVLISGLYGVAFLGLAVFNLLGVQLPYYLEAMGLQSGVGLGAVTGGLASIGYEHVKGRLGYRKTLAMLLGLFAAGALVMTLLAVGGGVWQGATPLPLRLRTWFPRPLSPTCPEA